MYDDKMEAKEFVGEDRSEALEKAMEFFACTEEQLAIFELDTAEVFGSRGRSILVAQLREHVGSRPSGGGRREGGRDEGRRDGGREERGDRGGRGGRGRGGRERGDRGDRGRGRDGGHRASASEEPEPVEADDAPAEPSVGTAVGELGEIGRFLCGTIERMGLGGFEISERSEEGVIAIQVRGAAAERLAEDAGRAADALQLLANQAAGLGTETPPRVVLDLEGEGDARESRLARLAERVAERARESGRPVRLEPMSGRDRRVIHVALKGMPGIATMSTGEGSYRQVVVVPEGSSEYERALREAESRSAD